MRIDKFTSSENSRSNWLKIGAKLLKPLCEHFKKKLLKMKSILNIDETWCSELQNYRMDGHYTIDNMIAERVIRPFTVNRKNSLFYSSE